jgi:hypothetical protein
VRRRGRAWVKRPWTKRWFRAALGLLSPVALGLLAVCRRFGIWSNRDYRKYRGGPGVLDRPVPGRRNGRVEADPFASKRAPRPDTREFVSGNEAMPGPVPDSVSGSPQDTLSRTFVAGGPQ